MTDRLLVITNASAGSAVDEAVVSALEVLEQEADVRITACSDAGELGSLLADREGRRPVVAGGDGSLHALVQALFERGELRPEEPVGLLPMGTGNDLARTLGVPRDPVESARAQLYGRPRRLDLLVDDGGTVVVNVVHAGIGAAAAQRASSLKGALGPAAYTVGSIAAGVAERGWNLRVVVDGTELWDGRQPALMVGVGVGRTVGGGSPLVPEAEPDDGLADVVVSLATGAAARAGYAAALRSGAHVDRDDVITARGRVVEISGEPFPVNADGELSGPYESRTWRILPGAWALVTGLDPHGRPWGAG